MENYAKEQREHILHNSQSTPSLSPEHYTPFSGSAAGSNRHTLTECRSKREEPDAEMPGLPITREPPQVSTPPVTPTTSDTRAKTSGEDASKGLNTASSSFPFPFAHDAPKKMPPPLPSRQAEEGLEFGAVTYLTSPAGTAERAHAIDWCRLESTRVVFPNADVPDVTTEAGYSRIPVDRSVTWDNLPDQAAEYAVRYLSNLTNRNRPFQRDLINNLLRELPSVATVESAIVRARHFPTLPEAHQYVNSYLVRCYNCLWYNQEVIDEVVVRRCLVQTKLRQTIAEHAECRNRYDVRDDIVRFLHGQRRRLKEAPAGGPSETQKRYLDEKTLLDENFGLLERYAREEEELGQFLKYTAYQRFKALSVRKREYTRFQEALEAFTYVHRGTGVNTGTEITMISMNSRVLDEPVCWIQRGVPITPPARGRGPTSAALDGSTSFLSTIKSIWEDFDAPESVMEEDEVEPQVLFDNAELELATSDPARSDRADDGSDIGEMLTVRRRWRRQRPNR